MDRESWLERQAELAALERRLQAELEAARARHERARTEFDRMAEIARELGLSTPDGTHALHKASRELSASTRLYREALNRFCNFILRGQFPDERKE